MINEAEFKAEIGELCSDQELLCSIFDEATDDQLKRFVATKLIVKGGVGIAFVLLFGDN